MVHSSQSPQLSTILVALLKKILQSSRNIIPILENYQVTTDPTIGTAILFLLDHLEDFLRREPALSLSEAEAASLERRRHLLRVLTILRGAHTELLRSLVQELETLLKDEEVSWNLVPLSFTSWLTMMLPGEETTLLPRLLSIKQRAMQAEDHLAATQIMTWLAFTYRQAGQLHQARLECLQALTLVEQAGEHTAMVGYLYSPLFEVSYARNRLKEAADWLDRLRFEGH